MTIGFPEIETPTPEKLVDFAVGFTRLLSARVFETDPDDPFQNCIEHGITALSKWATLTDIPKGRTRHFTWLFLDFACSSPGRLT